MEMSRAAITRIDVETKKSERKTDWIAREKPLYVFLGRTHCVTIFCSPTNLKELSVGHLLAEGFVKSVGEIKELNLDAKKMICRVDLKSSVNVKSRMQLLKPYSRVILSACGSGTPFQFSNRLLKVNSTVKAKADVVMESVRNLNFKAATFRKTGGVHGAAIYGGDGSFLAFAEDVGRHNAVDKVIGMMAMRSADFSECFLALTGRLSGDVVLKAAKVGISIVASMAAALDSGVAVARRSGITLIGFVRGGRMNIYAFPERILM